MNAELLTAEELGAELRVRPSTVKQWARAGRIPEVWLSSRVRRFRLEAVLKALGKTKPARC